MARADDDGDRPAAGGTPRRRLAVLLVLVGVPWTVILVGDDVVTLVFLPALVTSLGGGGAGESVHVVPLWELFAAGGGLPRNAELLPVSVLLYLSGLASAASGALRGREDPRVTASLCLLAAVAHLGVAVAFRHRPAYAPFPVAPLLLVGVVWWYYWPALRETLLGPVNQG